MMSQDRGDNSSNDEGVDSTTAFAITRFHSRLIRVFQWLFLRFSLLPALPQVQVKYNTSELATRNLGMKAWNGRELVSNVLGLKHR